MLPLRRAVPVFPSLLLAVACGRGGSSGSPTWGIALIAGPALIQQQLSNARAVLTDPPRGLPDSLPALVIQQKTGAGAVIVGKDAEGKISMQYRGPGFPPQGYGLLVVDDTSQRAGLVPLAVPTMLAPERAAAAVQSVRGLVLTGGADVAPDRYGATPHA